LQRLNRKKLRLKKYITLNELLDEVLPLLKQKYAVPSFSSLETLEFHPVIKKVVRPIPSARKVK